MVTIKDIARIAGVSHTTVSRALNNSPHIRLDTKSKILQIANDLKYVPNVSAKSLVTHKSYNIGLFFSSISRGSSSSFIVDTIHGVNQVVNGKYSISIEGIDALSDYSLISSLRFDGIIIMSQSDADDVFIQHISDQQIPLIVLNRTINNNHIGNIVANDSIGVKNAINKAIKMGHHKIGLISGKTDFRSSIDRQTGFFDSLKLNHISPNPAYYQTGDYSMASGFRCMNNLLKLKQRPTCVFCSNDDMAIGALKACKAANLEVPTQISLIGFDDIHVDEFISPTLTTIHKPIVEMTKTGTELLLKLLDGDQVNLTKLILETRFIMRESLSSN